MKRHILILIAIIYSNFSLFSQNVNIPDDNFKNALISAGVDTSGDGEISYAEAEAVTSLDVNSKSISDMKGIEAFVNIDTLSCSFNQLTSLDVSNNTGLEYLYCSDNQLTRLDVSNNTALYILNLSDMPSLYEVCVWEMPFPPARVDTEGSPNVYFTTECSATGSNPYQESNIFNIYPIPNSGYIKINLPAEYAGQHLPYIVYNYAGRQVLSGGMVGDILDLSKLSSGIYIVKIGLGQDTFREKIALLQE